MSKLPKRKPQPISMRVRIALLGEGAAEGNAVYVLAALFAFLAILFKFA